MLRVLCGLKLSPWPLLVLASLGLSCATASATGPETLGPSEPPPEVGETEGPARVSSHIEGTAAGDIMVSQELLINAPVSAVWAAYTTAEGWQACFAPLASVDLRAGGVIKTQYNPEGTLEDADANTLRIINYVPERILTLQADVSTNWPEIMKEDADRLYNVIVFEALGEQETKIVSYGLGYRESPEYRALMDFIIPANEGLLVGLAEWLESQEAHP